MMKLVGQLLRLSAILIAFAAIEFASVSAMSQDINGIESDIEAASKLADNRQDTEALPFAIRAYNAGVRLGDRNSTFLSSEHLLGSIYVRLGRYPEAEPLLRKAFEGRKSVMGLEHPDTLLSLNNLAFLYTEKGDYSAAEPLLIDSLAARRKLLGLDDPLTITSIGNLASNYWFQGRYLEAEKGFRDALERSRRVLGNEHSDTAMYMSNLGIVLDTEGHPRESEQFVLEAYNVVRKLRGDDHPDTLSAANNLAAVLDEEGRYGETLAIYENVFRKRQTLLGPDRPETLYSEQNLADVYGDMGRDGEYERHLKNVLEARRRTLGPEHGATLHSMEFLGYLYVRQGRYSEAEELLEPGYEISKSVLGAGHPDTIRAMSYLATLYDAEGSRDRADALYRQSIEAMRNTLGPEHPTTLTLQSQIALRFFRQGDDNSAETAFKDLMTSDGKTLGTEHSAYLSDLHNLASVYAHEGRLSESESLFRQAIAGYAKIYSPSHPSLIRSQTRLADVLARERKYEEAADVLDQCLAAGRVRIATEVQVAPGIKQREIAANSLSDLVNTAVSLAIRNNSGRLAQTATNAVLTFKGIRGEYEASLRRSAQFLPEASRDLTAQLSRAVDELNAAEQAADLDENKASIARAKREEVDALETRIADLVPSFKASLQPIDWHSLSVRLPDSAAFIDYFVLAGQDPASNRTLPERLIAIAQQGGADPMVRDLGPLADHLPDLNVLTAMNEQDEEFPAARIRTFNFLVRPFAKMLAARKTIYISPDGVLHRLPFELLRPGREQQYWLESHEITIVPTGRVIIEPPQEEATNPAIIVGAPDYGLVTNKLASDDTGTGSLVRSCTDGKGYAPLLYSATEVQQVRQILVSAGITSNPPLLGANASKAAIRSLKEAPRILHFATHACVASTSFASDPLRRVELALANANIHKDDPADSGRLSGAEIVLLPLYGTSLVALSACDTGAGSLEQSEGFMSLARAFRLSGAKRVLMTLSKIDDEKAGMFMVAFYRAWVANGMKDPNSALRQTKLEWIGRGEVVRNWATFILVETAR
jgi:CHAT domain-containing protein/tetratricopeptide (TPR) repeat protein